MQHKKDFLIQVIGKNNGVGLLKDAELIVSLIKEMNIEVVYKTPLVYAKKESSYIKYKFLKTAKKFIFPLFQYFPRPSSTKIINIFLEHIDPYYLYKEDINCFMPNPEWCEKSNSKYFSKIDYVLCKTFFTQQIFKSLSMNTIYTGFTSDDCLDPAMTDRSETFFHLAGSSLQKGTDVLVDLWLEHPEWPQLTIVQSPLRYKRANIINAVNINYILDHIDNESLLKLQNANIFHLCPSEAEGFGHYIVEAMSCGAITLTTDAPPMNEIVDETRGVLVKYKSKKPQELGMNFYVDKKDFEKQIIKILNMTEKEKKQMIKKSRLWFEENDEMFRLQLKQFITMLTSDK